MTYQDPDIQLEIGNPNQDSVKLEEFTFHHGHVHQVINTPSDLAGIDTPKELGNDISQMILITSTFQGNTSQDELKPKIACQPLLRGFSDSVAHGDSVIYTTIGDVNYYLGPLNTTNNPNYSPDSYYQEKNNSVSLNIDNRKDDVNGYNSNYIVANVSKHSKPKNIDLDRPYGTGIGEVGSKVEIESSYSDMSIEGRHNNHIALGSRFLNPYITIKNNSSPTNNGSVIGLFSLGSLFQNNINIEDLSSDIVVKKAIEDEEDYPGSFIGVGNDSTEAEGIPRQDRFNLNYSETGDDINQQTDFDQVIIFSDRITFDAQENDLTMSALRNINIGSGQNISITTKKHTLIQSENIYLGEQSKEKTEPMVLGNKLREVLVEILQILNSARANVQGVPLPLVDESGLNTLNASPEDIIPKLLKELDNLNPQTVEGESRFFSKHHFIEQNRS